MHTLEINLKNSVPVQSNSKDLGAMDKREEWETTVKVSEKPSDSAVRRVCQCVLTTKQVMGVVGYRLGDSNL